MTNGIDTQIVRAYESEGMTPQEISEDLGFEVTAIKAKLMQLSSIYRKDCGAETEGEDELNFSRDEQLQIKRELLNLALGTDDEHLKGKLLLNLRDDGKGRKDIVKKMQSNTFNILQINDMLQSARQNASRLRDSVMPTKLIKSS